MDESHNMMLSERRQTPNSTSNTIPIIKVQAQTKQTYGVTSQDSGYFGGSTCWHWEAGICLFVWVLVSWVYENSLSFSLTFTFTYVYYT